ncbi:MAG: Cna B-type domain-containing protein, partial [Ruminococcus sp.]|nr:Cna B-type domain-containing protein [Ruminococcus sp.]
MKNNDGKYILSTNEKSVTLTYKQKVNNIGNVYNIVTVKTPDGNNSVTGDNTVTYQSKSNLYNLTKEGSYDKDTHLIKWTVKVSSTNGSSLNGYKLFDEGFKNAVDSKFYVNYTNNEFNDYNLSESTMTLNSNSSNIEFYYYTKATASDSGKDVTNSVELKNPDDTSFKDPTSKTVKVDEFRNELSKQVVSYESNSVASKGEIKQVIGWKASITYDNNLANKTYTDTLSVNGESNATHTITQKQLDAIEVYAKVKNSDGRTKLVKGNDYTIDPTDNGFTVKFNATLDEKGYNYVDIEYNTTATIPASESYDTITEFKNSGSGFGDGASVSHSITRGNPNVDNKLNLIVNKTWDGNDDESKRPDVYIKVMYQTKVGNASASEWKPLKKDSSGNPSVEETLNDNYIVELKKDGTWSTVLNGLPMEKSYALDDGTKSEVTYYYYKLVEVDKDGTEIKHIPTENGLYRVSNSDNTNTDSASQSLTVTNTYYGNINITGIKNWSNDSDYTGDRKGVTVELRRSTDQYNWSSYTVVETKTLDSSNNWSYTWNNLPSRGFEHGDVVTYYYKLVETKCGDTTIDDNNKIIFTDNGYYESSVSSNVTNSSNQTLSVTNTFHKNIDISGQKIWRGDNIENKPAITLQLMRSEKDKNDWKEYRNLTLNSDSNWEYSFNNLPTKAMDNNQIKDYEYKVVETKIGNYNVSSNKAIVNNGYYIVSYSDNNAISNNKSDLNITNTFHKTKNLTITANKVWDDEGYVEKRPDSIILQLQKKANNGNWENFGDEKTIISNGDNQSCSWNNLVSQNIDDHGNVTEYAYKVVEVGYVVNGKTYRIPDNETLAIDTSGFYEIKYDNKELKDSGTVTVTNEFTPNGTISITPKKVWAKDTDTARYDNVTLRVQVKNGNEWVDYRGSDGNLFEVTFGPSENDPTETEFKDGQNVVVKVTWTGDVISNLPKQKITITEENVDGKTVRKIDTEYYTYRLVEVFNGEVLEANDKISVKNGNDKYEVTYSSEITMNNGEFTVTNTFVKNIGVDKYAVDVVVNNGNVIVKNKGKEISIDKDILTDENSPYKKTIDGKQYYVFNWVLDFDTPGMSSSTFDQLPKGFTLVDKEIYKEMPWGPSVQIVDFKTPFNSTVKNYCSDGYYWRPYFVYSNMNGASSTGITNPTKQSMLSQVVGSKTDGYFYDTVSNKVYFSKPKVNEGVVFEICYSTKVECATLDAMIQKKSYPVTNHVIKLEDNGKETKEDSEATVLIKNQAPSDLISKEYVANANQGWIGFSLDINPDGKNLSNGDTIDIEDIFKTESYIDKDKDNQFTPGSNLVDVLMKSISIYSVDANGNETKLDRNNYILNFESNEKGVTNRDNETGEALIKLTVPDETHIRVKYLYKMIANNNTPSVRNGCKSSERDKVTGKFPIMAPGMVPPVGDTITFSNTAKLYSDGVSAEDSVNSQEYVVSRSGATISTNALPKIKKVNVGNYNINNLSSKFLLARYDDSKKQWLYATEINEQNAITKWSDGFTGLTVCKNAEPINVGESYYQISLDKNSLYKLVEVRVPTGYEGSNLNLSDAEFEQLIRQYLNDKTKTKLNGKDYSVFLEKYVPVYYFVYNSIITSYPDGINSSDVIQVKSGEDVEIPNSELIDIGVDKQWVDGEKADSTIDVELYWSYNKSTSKMPSDAQLATAEELGIMYGGFSANKTVNSGKNQKVWEDLPNGKDSKPIYYYIKETAYTIDNMKYTLVTDKEKENYGKYVTENGYVGEYFPTYVGNATNSDSVITVNNSQKLILKKVWKNASNMPLSAGKIPADEILVTIYGTDKSDAEVELFKDVRVTKDDNWERDITELLKTNEINLEDYKSFRAEESGFDTKDYVVSCVFNLNADTGEITVTNKCVNATDASVTVNKSWSDGNDTHEKDSIKVSLYQSTSPISDITNLTSDDLSGAKLYENVELNVKNDWSYTWTGLPLDNSTDETNATESYYYYVLETDVIIDGDDENKTNAKKYETTYSYDKPNNSKTTYTINNTRNSIKVQKEWYDVNNELIPNEFIDEADGSVTPNEALNGLEIKLSLYEKAENPLIRDGCHPSEEGYEAIANEYLNAIQSIYATPPEKELEIIALGDSITDGYQTFSKGEKCYPSKLTSFLTNKSYKLKGNSVVNRGESGQRLGNSADDGDTIRNRVKSQITDTADIVLLLGGTNDIHQDRYNNNAWSNPTECMRRLEACIGEIQAKAENAIIIVGSIPHFDYVGADGNATTASTWWGVNEEDANKYIDQYNALINAYTESNDSDNVYYVDTCTAVDGISPAKDENGNPLSEITLNSGNNWTAIVDVTGNDKYYFEETQVILSDEDVTDDWKVSYKDNGQTAGGQTPIIVKNKKAPVPTTSVFIEKTWVGDNADTDASERAKIKLELWRTATPDVEDSWEWYADVDSQHTGTGNVWTYTCDNLPAKDNFGNAYSYKVVELDMDGYTVSYDNPDSVIALENGNAGTLKLTNTRTVSLKFKKIWSDGDTNEHLNDKVEVKVYRSTNPDDAKKYIIDDKNLILHISSENVSVGVNSSTSVTANKSGITAT